MIKARGKDADGYPVYFFGLSAGNIELLRKGMPIMVNLRELDGRGHVVILFGETEEAIRDEMLKHFSVEKMADWKNPNG